MTRHDWFHHDLPVRPAGDGDAPVHLSVVLDRSGSMGAIAGDVVGGFNEFLAEQRAQPGRARITLAQFDSHDPFEILIDGAGLHSAPDLDPAAYQPRGLTPLYDAVAKMLRRIDRDAARRRREGLPEEDQVVAIVTDGLENASRRATRASIFRKIEERRRRGWVFVFLGANQDAYATGHGLAVAPQNRAGWEATPKGSKKMWGDLSHSSSLHRAKARARRKMESDAFFTERPGP